ncbi:MAG: hypothetical protein IJS99_00420 [Synergistaceae bacterium]|nr:hypothetical protein [Synergistaceae bacterium]
MKHEKIYVFAFLIVIAFFMCSILCELAASENISDKNFADTLSDLTSEKIICYQNIVERAKLYEECINWNIALIYGYNPVVRLDDGYLTAFNASLDVGPDAESVINFAKFCETNGADFFYLSLPHKICESQDKDISGILDYCNQNTNRFLDLIGEIL